MTLGKGVTEKRVDHMKNLLNDLFGQTLLLHAHLGFGQDGLHHFFRALVGHCSSCFLRLLCGESGDFHEDAERLFLEKDDSVGALQDWFK